MRKEVWQKIRSCYGSLIAELDLKSGAPSVIDILYSKGVLLHYDKNRLQETPVPEDKIRLLLDILQTKDDDAYRIFAEAVQTIQPHVSEMLPPPGPPKGRPGVKPAGHLATQEQIGNFSTTELKKWIQQILEHEPIPEDVIRSTVETVEKEMIDGSVFVDMMESDFKSLFTSLRFGPMKKLIKARDQLVKGEHSDRSQERQSAYEKKSELQRTEYVRDFGHDLAIFENYHKGRILNKHEERAGNLINPVRQFFPCISESADFYQYIADKVTVFGAACLNDRTNGTIYFGIGDIDCEQFAYGEVLGITLDKKECEDVIRLSLTRFSEEVRETAERCIRPPFFIPVIDAAGDRGLIVCEVDIEPRSEWVKELAFFVSPVSKTTESASDMDPELYRFSAGIPKKQDAKQIEKFSGEKVLLTKDREQQDREQQEKSLTSSRNQNLVETLKDYMCGGGDTLEGNFYPILATPSITVSHPDFLQSFQFIFHVDWRCILDFDPKSDENGLYCYADNEKKQVYNLKTPDSFLPSFPDKHPTKSSFEDQLQDFMESLHRQWIFCNGYATGRDEGFPVHQWKQKRSEGYRETVRWLKQSIPEGRAVILILVTSHDDVFIEASEDLILKFEAQWLMVSQSRRLAEAWIDGLRQRNVIVDKDRCICGFSFSEVNKAIIQLLGCQVLEEGQCVVTTTPGVQEMLTIKQVQQDLCDLNVVSADQCCSAKPQNKEEFLKLSAETEENFYKGNTATWWNFYFQGHVCKRDRYDHLLTYTRETLRGKNASDNDVIGRVAIYHQPGAGGTTVALNVLWDLKSEYKCCQIRRITEETARQIFTLYEVGEGDREHKKPVLVMLDNEDEDKINILTKKIIEECDRKISEIVCIFLICTRRMSLPQEHEKKKIILLHKLSPRECQFFLDKYKNLMEQYSRNKGRVNPDSLLGLNIMKENFSEDYIKRTVKTLLEVFQKREEKTVLKYLALLNKYDPSFRGIPVTCFDPLMVGGSSKAWEGRMPVQPLLTFTYNKQLSGRTNCLRISCQLLCSYILDISLDDDKSHGDLMEELICSPVIQRPDPNVAYQQLLRIIKEIMTKRYWTDDQTRSTFSLFIQNLYDKKEYELAAICMVRVFERTDDAVLAQQLARFYIACKNWNNAEMWAEEAVKRWPQNSFILDTKGQVSKYRLLELLTECEANQGSVSLERVMEAVHYAQQGCDHFKQEQNLCSSDSPNMAGYFGQMDIISYLIKILKCSSIFHLPLELQRFFSDKAFVPEELRKSESLKIQWLKSLQDQAFLCLSLVEDYFKLSSVNEQENSAQTIFVNERNLDRYRTQLNGLFTEEALLNMDPQKMKPEQRREVVKKLAGCSLFSMIKTYREKDGRDRVLDMNTLMSLNLNPSSRNRFDLSMALASAICLCSDLNNLSTQNPYLRNVLEWSEELCRMKQQGEYIDLDPFLYFLVFHWPTPKRGFLCPPSELHKIMNRADEAFRKKQQQNPRYQKSSSSPLFFLTNQPPDNSIVSQDKLAAWAGSDCRRIHRVNRLLKSPQAVNLLERFSGVLDSTGWKVKVTLESQEGNKMDVDIPLFTRENRQILKMKRVYFVLGFGYHGPVACDVDSSRPFPAQGSQPLGVVHHQLPRYLYPPPLPNYDQKIEEILHEIRQARLALSENGPPQKREQLSQTIRNLETELQKYQILRRSATLHNSM